MDHVKDYRPPKDLDDIDDVTKHLREEGCAPKAPVPSSSSKDDEQYTLPVKKPKKGEALTNQCNCFTDLTNHCSFL